MNKLMPFGNIMLGLTAIAIIIFFAVEEFEKWGIIILIVMFTIYSIVYQKRSEYMVEQMQNE